VSDTEKTRIGGVEIKGKPRIIAVSREAEGLACPDCACAVTFTIMIQIDPGETVRKVLKEIQYPDVEGVTQKLGDVMGVFPGCAACGWRGPLAIHMQKDGKHEVAVAPDCDANCEECDRERPDAIDDAEEGMKERGEDGMPPGLTSVPMPSASPIEVPPLWKKKN
jgi:hypothetical protein